MFRPVSSLPSALALLGFSSFVASAQSLIPSDLALALTSGYESAGIDARFTIGELPEGVPSEAVPPGVEILGGISSPARSTAVLMVPGSYADLQTALGSIEEQLRDSGWEGISMSPSSFVVSGADGDPRADRPQRFCRDGAMLRIDVSNVSPRPGAASLRVEVDRFGPPRDCSARRVGSLLPDIPIPQLRAPDGSMHGGSTVGSSMSAGEGSYEARSELRTTLSPAQLSRHFAEQIRAAGWTLEEPTLLDSVVSQPISFSDRLGRQWRGVLGIAEVPGFEGHQVLFRVWRDSNRQGQVPSP